MRRRVVTMCGVMLTVIGLAGAASAQTPKPASTASSSSSTSDWFGYSVGVNPGMASLSGAFETTSIPIQQITNINVQGRGLVVVPGTTRPFPITSIGTGTHPAIALTGGFTGHSFGRLIWGVDGDYTFGASGNGTQSQHLDIPPTALQNGINYDVTRAIKISAGGSVRGRVGYLLDFLKGDLVYFTGGLGFASGTVTGTEAFAADPTDSLVPQPCPGPNCSPAILASPFSINLTESHTHTGFVFGVGWQHRVGRLLIIGAEYRHSSLGANYSVGASTITEQCTVDGPSNFITSNSGCTAALLKGDTSTPAIGERKLSIKSNSVLFTLQVRLDKLLGR